MTLAARFNEDAQKLMDAEVQRLRTTLSFEQTLALPDAQFQDIVIAGREVQLTTFRQTDLADLGGAVLVTVQLARHSLGGVVSFKIERGLVWSASAPPRDASEAELLNSAK